MFSYCAIKFQHCIWCHPPHTQCSTNCHRMKKHCKRMQYYILRILFLSKYVSLSGAVNKILSRCISLHKALFSLVLSFLSYSPMRITESCVLSRCVNNWPRWSETYPNIQTHVFFPAQDISSDKYYGKVAVSKTLFTLALPKVNGFF